MIDGYKLIRRIGVVILLGSLAIGCSDNEKTTLCFLNTFTETASNGEVTTSAYTYTNSRPSKWLLTLPSSQTISASFIYGPEGRLDRLSTQHSSNGLGIVDYFYDSLGRLSKEKAENAPGTYTIHYQYYSVSQQLTKTYYVEGADTLKITSYTYPDIVTINPSVIETLDVQTGLSETHEYTYDDKIYPLRGILPTGTYVNNITSDTTVGGSTKTYSYQYNGAGYPVSATTNDGITQSWTYDCQEI